MSLAQNQYVIQLPTTPAVTGAIDARAIAQQWLTKLEVLLTRGAYDDLATLFHEESWWRDMLVLDWDMRSIHTRADIEAYLRAQQPTMGLSALRLQHEGTFQPARESPVEGLTWITSMFFFESRAGRGSGVLYLTQDEAGAWKAYSIYTALQELKSFEEPLGLRRAEGTIESMPGGLAKGNWLERRSRQVEFMDEEPTTLVVGAGIFPSNIYIYQSRIPDSQQDKRVSTWAHVSNLSAYPASSSTATSASATTGAIATEYVPSSPHFTIGT